MAKRPLFFLLLVLFSACEKPLRLPYITPELHNWPKTYKGVTGLRLHVFTTGTLAARDKLVYRDGGLLGTVPLDILVFVIEHPRRGLILVGTGLNRKIADDTERYLGAFRASLGTPAMEKGQDILAQLKRAKLPAAKVRYIILPDLRFDHTGALASFPSAQPVVSSAEYEAATDEKESPLSLSKEYAEVREWRFIDFAGAQPLGTFLAHRDLFNDGSVLLLDASGATAGGLAVLVRLPAAPVLLGGNLAWTKKHYLYTRLPGLLFDREACWEKIWRLKKFKDLVPELAVLPDHDWEAVEAAKTKDMVLHPFPAGEAVEASGKEGRGKKPNQESKNPGRKRHEGKKTGS
ncbi:MAG TPA: MBL fold metallo-hydrolase [Candidatus Binatia bacterium]|jgi:glyoxylase-like metal-dependent hydrolase (beta-lactamase superfamily II)|nr:MBL fold metallo-hydrolase [Candidatus Binatia bacterium]